MVILQPIQAIDCFWTTVICTSSIAKIIQVRPSKYKQKKKKKINDDKDTIFKCFLISAYVEVETKVCSAKCTQRDQPQNATTPMPPSSITTPKVSTVKSSGGIKTTKVTSTKENTETSTIFVALTTLRRQQKKLKPPVKLLKLQQKLK